MTTINVHLGTGDESYRRKAALNRLAERDGFTWGGYPSVGRMIVALADEEIARFGREEASDPGYPCELFDTFIGDQATTEEIAAMVRAAIADFDIPKDEED